MTFGKSTLSTRLLARGLAVVAIAALTADTACSFINNSDAFQCQTNADCKARGAGFDRTLCNERHVCVLDGACLTNQECIDANAGAPFICRKDTRSCVSLTSEDCILLAEPSDIADDHTIWVGSLWPYLVPKDPPDQQFGIVQVNSMDLARRELAKIGNGLPPPSVGKPRRPLAIVSCNDQEDVDVAVRATKHLLDLGVPAVIGSDSSGETLKIATTLTIPAGVFYMSSSNASPLFANVPDNNLLWRTYPSAAAAIGPTASLLVPAVMEPSARTKYAIPAGTDIKLAVLFSGNAYGQSLSDEVLKTLKFNGKTPTANGSNYLAINYGDATAPDFTKAQFAVAKDALLTFRPNIILTLSTSDAIDGILSDVESGWTFAGYRPFHFIQASVLPGTDLFTGMGSNADLRTRVISADLLQDGKVHDAFIASYNAAYPRTPLDPSFYTSGDPYDGFYAIAYAIAALGDKPVTGANIGNIGMLKLVPPATNINVGTADMFQAFSLLSSGQGIDLTGESGSLDWDVTTGEISARSLAQCIGVDASADAGADAGVGTATIVPSGMTYDPKTKMLVGQFSCP